MKRVILVLFLLFFAQPCSSSQPLVYDDGALDGLLDDVAVSIIPVDMKAPEAEVDFTIPGIGSVRLAAKTKEDGMSKMEGEFPVEGDSLFLGPLEVKNGFFEVLSDGSLRYLGSGFIGGKAINVGLKKLRFLTPEEKVRIDKEYVDKNEKKGKKIADISQKAKKLGDSFAIQEAIFSLESPTGFVSIFLGDWFLFNFTRAELVVGYRQVPYIRLFVSVGGKPVEVHFGLEIKKTQLVASLKAKDLSLLDFVPDVARLFGGLPIQEARFSGEMTFDTSKGLSFTGQLSDASGSQGWNISPISEHPVFLNTFSLSLDSKRGPVFESAGSMFGSDVVFSGSFNNDSGISLSASLVSDSAVSYIPWLPKDIFGDLNFEGSAKWSSKDGVELDGQLVSPAGDLSIFGVTLSQARVSCNLSKKQVVVHGGFSVFDLAVIATFSLDLGDERTLTCSFELADKKYADSWTPPSLSDYLSGQEKLEPFVFKNIRIVAGLESKKHPFKVLKKLLKDRKENQENRFALPAGSQSRLFFTIEGEVLVLGQQCRALAMVEKKKKLGVMVLAEPVGEFSLAKAFPDEFMHRPEDNVIAQYLKNVVGGAALADVLLVLSTVEEDIEFGIKPGLNLTGSVAYAGDPRENPLFKPFFSGTKNDLFSLEKKGDQGIGISISALIDPINFKNSFIKGTFSTGDYGLFLHLPNVEEVGIKQLAVDIVFAPFSFEGSVDLRCLYVSPSMEQALRLSGEVAANLVDVGGSISAVGDFDLAAYLPFIMGREVRDVLSQRIILGDGSFEFKTTWAALASLVESIGSAIPTLGVGTVLGAIAFFVTSISSLGLSGKVEIGQGNDPLVGRLAVKAGVDVSELVFELYGEKTGGFTSLVCFLFDMLLYITTFGQKGILLPDMRLMQEQIAKIVPIDIEKFWLKFVPLGTRIGEVVVPFGIGGGLRLNLFGGTSVGTDLVIDSKGAYAAAYIDPVDLWGFLRLRPSKTLGTAAQEIEAQYNTWGLSSENAKGKDKKIILKASAHLEEGFAAEADFDIDLASSVGGSVRARFGLNGLDLQGDMRVKIPELVETLGVDAGELKFWVKGTQVDLDNPLFLLQQLNPRNIGLEIGLEDSLKKAVLGTVERIIKSVEDRIEALALDDLLLHTKKLALYKAEEMANKACSKAKEDLSYASRCASTQARLGIIKSKEFVLDRLDEAGLSDLPEVAQKTIIALKDAGIIALRGGQLVVGSLYKLFSIERVVWKGTLQDLSQGKIPGFDVSLRLFGSEVQFLQLGAYDLTKPPIEWIKQLSLDIAQSVIKRVTDLFGDLVSSKAVEAIVAQVVLQGI